VVALEPTSVGRQGLELRNAWRRRSSTQQGDEARGHKPRGSTGAQLSNEVRSGPRDTWRLRSQPLQGGVNRSYSLCGSTWMHVLLLVLT
jgi:hypothetical protein